MITRQMDEQEQELHRKAKTGDPSAVEELRGRNIKIWTYDELKALNTFLQNKDKCLRSEPVFHTWSTHLRRQFNTPLEVAEQLWVRYIADDYALHCFRFHDGVIQYWIGHHWDNGLVSDVTFLCCVNQWLEKEIHNDSLQTRLRPLSLVSKRVVVGRRSKRGSAS